MDNIQDGIDEGVINNQQRLTTTIIKSTTT